MTVYSILTQKSPTLLGNNRIIYEEGVTNCNGLLVILKLYYHGVDLSEVKAIRGSNTFSIYFFFIFKFKVFIQEIKLELLHIKFKTRIGRVRPNFIYTDLLK